MEEGGSKMELLQPELVLALLLAVLVIMLVRVLREDQRVTSRLLGRKLAVKGPGLVLRVTWVHQDWRKHTLGDRGVLLDNGHARLNGVEVLVDIDGGAVHPSQSVTLSRFAGSQGGSRFVVESSEAAGHRPGG